VSSWNAGAQRIKGYRREEIVGKHFSSFYNDEDVNAGKPWEEIAQARRTGRAEDEGWRVRKNGERFWAKVVLTALHDAEGQLRGFAKVTQDLTERRYVQDLEAAAKNVNEFIGMLAHELRNPLAPIRAAVEIMRHKALDAATQEAMRQTIDRQSAHLTRIVDDLLDIARVTRGSLALETGTVHIAEVVERALETADPLIKAGGHEIQVDLPALPIAVQGDAFRLTQVVANLLNNSARYTPQGGRIWVSVREEDRWVALRVRDTGRGIDAQMMPRIFDMFVQGTGPHHRSGLGVGLALARRIAELHGGSVEARSEGGGKGSEFTLRLPAAVQAERSAKPPKQETAAKPAQPIVPRRILVVDDNVDAATTVNLLLNSLGHETLVVYGGVQALQAAADFRPDVVLLDIGMPGMDGYEVARRLRTLKRERPFRMVALTGWGNDVDRERSKEAGFDLHLVKPVDPEHLAKVVSERNSPTLH
jgi:PAS domain S-box-containing protein